MSGQIKQRHKMEVKRWEKEKKVRVKKAKKNKKELNAIEEQEKAMLERHAQELAGVQEGQVSDTVAPSDSDQIGDHTPGGPSKAQKKREAKMRKEEAFAQAFQSGSDVGARQQEIDKLTEKLSAVGLCVREIAPDGHCLYNSISDQLEGAKNVSELRNIAADYLEANRDDFAPFIEQGVDFQRYCNTVRDTNEWGGQLEVTALSKALHRCIIVHSADSPPLKVNEEIFADSKPLQITFNRHYIDTGEHYNSTAPK